MITQRDGECPRIREPIAEYLHLAGRLIGVALTHRLSVRYSAGVVRAFRGDGGRTKIGLGCPPALVLCGTGGSLLALFDLWSERGRELPDQLVPMWHSKRERYIEVKATALDR